jgi:hypothetical protein
VRLADGMFSSTGAADLSSEHAQQHKHRALRAEC